MKFHEKIITSGYEGACGRLTVGSYGDRLCLCDWAVEGHHNRVVDRLRRMLGAELVEGSSAVVDSARRELDEYFAGRRREFDIPLLFVGTEFQKQVWNALLTVPFGTTVSYGELARRIGRPKSVRAVANANGANAVSIFVPCHRVVGSDRSLTGYAGGLEAKACLLGLEQAGAVDYFGILS